MRIRPAYPGDLPAIEACVAAAYAPYVSRIGKKPAPMLADYAGLVAGGRVHVLEGDDADGLIGLIVLRAEPDHLFVENVAVRPEAQGRGLGRRLMRFAEEQAARRGLVELRLYTHERMTENIALYPRLGYEEVERREEAGYRRVFFRKRLARGGSG